MPAGDAARIRQHLLRQVNNARVAGKTETVFRAGDVRDTIGLSYSDAIIDICQVIETKKFQNEAGVELLAKSGPKQGINTDYRFSVV